MKEYKKILITLPNGDQLAAEECPHVSGQIAVGVVHDGVWVQDLAVIEASSENQYVENEFNVYVYENEYNESYTKCFNINRVPNNAL